MGNLLRDVVSLSKLYDLGVRNVFWCKNLSFPSLMALVSPRRRCRFGVLWKSFEILFEEVKRKLVGKTCERGRGSSSEIKLEGKGLSFLVEGVKAVVLLSITFGIDWMEDRRS